MKNSPEFIDIDEMYSELDRTIKLSDEDNDRKRKYFAREVIMFGDEAILKSNKNHKKKEKKHLMMVKYIIKCGNDQFGDYDELLNTPLEDIESIYIQVKVLNKPWYKKLIEFIMDWEDK